MGVRHLLVSLGLGHPPIPPQATSRFIRPGEPPEQISILHADGTISEVLVSSDEDELHIHVTPALTHSPHLSGGYV